LELSAAHTFPHNHTAAGSASQHNDATGGYLDESAHGGVLTAPSQKENFLETLANLTF
jgi:hypothetical protein